MSAKATHGTAPSATVRMVRIGRVQRPGELGPRPPDEPEHQHGRYGGRRWPALQCQCETQAIIHLGEHAGRESSDLFRQTPPVYGEDLRDIRHGVARKPRHPRADQDIPGRIDQTQIGRQNHHRHRGQAAPVERVIGDDQNRPTITRCGTVRIGQIRPPNVTSRDDHVLYQDSRGRASSCACVSAGSSRLSSAAYTAFRRWVIWSVSYFARNSASARAYSSLRLTPRRLARRSPDRCRSSGREMAVFIPEYNAG